MKYIVQNVVSCYTKQILLYSAAPNGRERSNRGQMVHEGSLGMCNWKCNQYEPLSLHLFSVYCFLLWSIITINKIHILVLLVLRSIVCSVYVLCFPFFFLGSYFSHFAHGYDDYFLFRPLYCCCWKENAEQRTNAGWKSERHGIRIRRWHLICFHVLFFFFPRKHKFL